eukprot:TRINITY_DN14653_c0_g1_i1.p1 TRINITY_DN14653_c0_g1~~TRINITY_DN14653_c0_g1_i1.p1  ORF type:complete len:708 (-),score=121.84 TRINITY_DN14653_c0_g1_i1:551-2674(-)
MIAESPGKLKRLRQQNAKAANDGKLTAAYAKIRSLEILLAQLQHPHSEEVANRLALIAPTLEAQLESAISGSVVRTAHGLVPADTQAMANAAKHHFSEPIATVTPKRARQVQHRARSLRTRSGPVFSDPGPRRESDSDDSFNARFCEALHVAESCKKPSLRADARPFVPQWPSDSAAMAQATAHDDSSVFASLLADTAAETSATATCCLNEVQDSPDALLASFACHDSMLKTLADQQEDLMHRQSVHYEKVAEQLESHNEKLAAFGSAFRTGLEAVVAEMKSVTERDCLAQLPSVICDVADRLAQSEMAMRLKPQVARKPPDIKHVCDKAVQHAHDDSAGDNSITKQLQQLHAMIGELGAFVRACCYVPVEASKFEELRTCIEMNPCTGTRAGECGALPTRNTQALATPVATTSDGEKRVNTITEFGLDAASSQATACKTCSTADGTTCGVYSSSTSIPKAPHNRWIELADTDSEQNEPHLAETRINDGIGDFHDHYAGLQCSALGALDGEEHDSQHAFVSDAESEVFRSAVDSTSISQERHPCDKADGCSSAKVAAEHATSTVFASQTVPATSSTSDSVSDLCIHLDAWNLAAGRINRSVNHAIQSIDDAQLNDCAADSKPWHGLPLCKGMTAEVHNEDQERLALRIPLGWTLCSLERTALTFRLSILNWRLRYRKSILAFRRAICTVLDQLRATTKNFRRLMAFT